MVGEAGITVLAVGLGAAAQAATGFGLALIAVPLLSLVMPPLKAVALGLLLPIPLNAFILFESGFPRSTVNLLPLVASGVVTLPVGVYLLTVSPPAIVQVVIGTLTLVLTGLAVKRPGGWRTDLPDSLVGALSGVASGATGMGGPLLGLLLLSKIRDKDRYRAVLLLYLLVLNVCAFLALVAMTPVLPLLIPSLAITLPVLAAGLAAGRFAFRLMGLTGLRRLVLGLACSAGAISLATGLAHLVQGA
ncbi:MAG: TSUP family transporter [Candidatus Rokuibacteriota bacterium]